MSAIEPGLRFNRIGRYELGGPCYASPAVSDGQVFLRGFKHVFCIGERASSRGTAMGGDGEGSR